MTSLPFIWRNSSPTSPLAGKVRVHYQDPGLVERLSHMLSEFLQTIDPAATRPVVVVSIGTDRSTGDCLGPLAGSKLHNLANPTGDLQVFGTLDDPVHASNLTAKLELITKTYHNPVVIAIDACLGHSENVGYITLAPGPLKPGAGVNKNLPAVGEIHITGIVNVGGYMEYFVLQNTRLSLVMHMSEQISQSIWEGYQLARPRETRGGVWQRQIQ